MKITKFKLRRLIRERLKLAMLTEGGHWPGSALSLKALVPLADAIAHDTGANMWDIGELLAELVKKEFYGGKEGPSPY